MLRSCRLKDEGRMLEDEGLRLKGVLRTDGQTDICDCRVAFVTEKSRKFSKKCAFYWNLTEGMKRFNHAAKIID